MSVGNEPWESAGGCLADTAEEESGGDMKVIDMHCDTISSLLELQEAGRPEGLRSNSRQVDLLRMKESHYFVQNFALFVVLAGRGDP